MPVSSPERPACSSLASPYQSCDPANSSSWVVLPTSSMPSSDPYFALPAPQSTPTMAPLVDNMSSSTTLMASSELCAHSSDVTSLWYEAIAKYKADTGLYLDAKQGPRARCTNTSMNTERLSRPPVSAVRHSVCAQL
ncbi:hypothetical protein BD626DRAFT_515345 [Schizophyllum amplum]|uniref:Uncharacterized protein n=1 Tax=Schizophyllum amplum TaxID=97359 RepID=A0A550BXP9_9AGAR|nr:hypothetical protein BD626DRAFT_515345 [Auriculariopsis ampla]